LTSFALYEAYGTRPQEWLADGSGDPDRQKANTKEEESDLGLLNEGFRYRDLEIGTFLTRDPIGYADGPNVYCYVHCNPITRFDPLGLWRDDGHGGLTYDGHYNIYNEDGADRDDYEKNMELSYRDIEDRIKNNRCGFDGGGHGGDYVKLPNGSVIRVTDMQAALRANDITSSSSRRYKGSRSAYAALEVDGHMSSSDAEKVRDEVVSGGEVVSFAEHWSARYILNDHESLAKMYARNRSSFFQRGMVQLTFSNGEVWRRQSKMASAYHGEGAYKWCSSFGRELVIDRYGNIESRVQFYGTYNFGNNPFGDKNVNHYDLDMDPYYFWGSAPGDSGFYLSAKERGEMRVKFIGLDVLMSRR
jgi:RHS repeat-associated protein